MRSARAALAATAAALTMAGCGGGGDETQTEAHTTAPVVTPSRSLTIQMSEYAFAPKFALAKAGEVTVKAADAGSVPHELVLLSTDASPSQLPHVKGHVDESSSVGKIPPVEPGRAKTHVFKLKPGRYVMVCGLPDHYESGMWGTITVVK